MTVLGVDDIVKPMHSLVEIDDVVEYLFVDPVSVDELAKIDALCCTNNLDLSLVVISRDIDISRDF